MIGSPHAALRLHLGTNTPGGPDRKEAGAEPPRGRPQKPVSLARGIALAGSGEQLFAGTAACTSTSPSSTTRSCSTSCRSCGRRTPPPQSFRQLLREISLLLAYEVTRDLPMTTKRIETPLQEMDAPMIEGQEARARLDPARGQRPARRHPRTDPGRARRLRRPLPQPRDAPARAVLLQGPDPARGPHHHRRRPDARHRQLLGRRHRPPQEGGRDRTSASSASSPRPKA